MKESSRLKNISLFSKVGSEGELEIFLHEHEITLPADDEIIVRVEAAPVNPADLGLLLGAVEPAVLRKVGEGLSARLIAPLQDWQLNFFARRLNLSLCPGLEGAGTVVQTGSNHQYLLGKTVSMFGGGMFTQYRKVKAVDCMVFPDGMSPSAAAGSFVNPLTALGMLETRRREGHQAMVLTAAASNLGQMLVKLCLEDGVELINIVRSQEQVELLRSIGAARVLNSTAPDFQAELTENIRQTGATLAFDAIGGGPLPSAILTAMEEVFAPEEFSLYGSTVHKQLYIYGILDPSPIQITRSAGIAWGVAGWLMMNYLAQLEPETVQAMKDRIVRQIETNFASHYLGEIGLQEMLNPEVLTRCSLKATGAKYLLNPNR